MGTVFNFGININFSFSPYFYDTPFISVFLELNTFDMTFKIYYFYCKKKYIIFSRDLLLLFFKS